MPSRQLEAFLSARGYRVAPVTIDNDEYIFAQAYDRASVRGDRDTMRRVAAAYVPYMDAKLAFFERNSMELFGREIRQILLVHANMLNADEFDRLAQTIEHRGYRFITLERALEDPALQSADTYIGPAGITWLQRWALTNKMPKSFFQGEPEVPLLWRIMLDRSACGHAGTQARQRAACTASASGGGAPREIKK